ncbi:hypothetical protein NX774_20450 [Massilia agilis]|uniref:Lipoprotein n=1 Tax=Massilia agilis TaxID=1811226 RepID=A0ABT2DG47_9BURK|nr:hypothetical protein [Massilia agilis]MCS0810300.1 hypothetical protein [Massilia agilis]
MKSSLMALAVGVALAGCSTGDGNVFASRDKTVEYYRVFDIKTAPGNPGVVKAASEGISRHVADATLATPAMAGQLQEQPGKFKPANPDGAAPGSGAAPSCEGASWTAKGAPRVNGGDNMNVVACLFPYKNGYHLDMYAVFTKKEGGWLEWPRRFTGRLMGTPESWTDQTMVDVVRTIRDSTGAQVALVEAKPALPGTPWLEMGSNGGASGSAGGSGGGASAPAGSGTGGSSGNSGTGGASGSGAASDSSGASATTSTAAPAPVTAPVAAPGSATAADSSSAGAAQPAGTGGSASAAGSGGGATGKPGAR